MALWRAEHVASLLRAATPGLEVSLHPVVTQGDRIQDRPLAEVGSKGLFIKELELAIAADQADLAVHSMKDVPADLAQGFTIAAVLPQADARDAFVSHAGMPVSRRCRPVHGSVRRARAGRAFCEQRARTCVLVRCAATSIRGCASSTMTTTTRSCWRSPG